MHPPDRLALIIAILAVIVIIIGVVAIGVGIRTVNQVCAAQHTTCVLNTTGGEQP